MKPFKIFTMMTLLLAFTACQKEDNTDRDVTGNKPAPTKQELLTAKTWVLSAMTIDPAYMGKTDMLDMMDPCEKDNTLKFSAGSSSMTLLIDEGSNVCSGNNQQGTTTWYMDPAGSNLTIGKQAYSLKSLASDGFQLVHSIQDGGTDYTITETYTAK